MYDKYQESSHFITINVRDEKQKGMQLIQELGYTFPVIYDEDSMITEIYRIQPIPMNFFIDKDGIIKWRILGKISESEIEYYLDSLLE